MPSNPIGLVLFAHGSGSSRLSPRNRFVAEVLHQSQIASLLFDLLTYEEDKDYERRFDIELLTKRLIGASEWYFIEFKSEKKLPLAYFGASTGAAAALKAAVHWGEKINSVVSRGGRPDLALEDLSQVKSPTLLIVGGEDYQVIELNQKAYDQLECVKELSIVPGATHLFEEEGTLEKAATLATNWFQKYF